MDPLLCGAYLDVHDCVIRFASLTALVEPELVGQRLGGRICHQQLVLLWGKQQPLLVSKETWLLELEASSAEFHWRKVIENI